MEAARSEEFVRLLAGHQEELFRYIFTLLPHEEDARYVLQETCVALYRKFADYDASKPFLAWAYGFACLEVLKQRERNQRGIRHLSREVFDRLVQERAQHEPLLLRRLQALEHCLAELPPADQRLIRERYQGKGGTVWLVQQFATSRRTLFRDLERIRRLLLDCINRHLAAADLT